MGGIGKVGSSGAIPLLPGAGAALPTVGIEIGPGSGMGMEIGGLWGMSPPPSGGVSAACRLGSG